MPVKADPPANEDLDSKDTTVQDKDTTKPLEDSKTNLDSDKGTTAQDKDVTQSSEESKNDASEEKQEDQANNEDKKSKPPSKPVIEEVRPEIYGYTSEYWLPKITLTKFDQYLTKHNRTLIMYTSSAPGMVIVHFFV